MQFRDDRRGQAIQIGAVLLLGALVLAFSIYQATVVPEQNREVEFQHSQQVQSQLQDVRNAVVSAGSEGSSQSVAVTLGTDYPPRLVALNPSPPSGTLATVGTTDAGVNATVANAVAAGETGDFWNGTNRTYNTGALVYRPDYNVYGEAPTTWYEHSVLYNEFRETNLTVTGQRLVDDDRLSLVTLNGSFYSGQADSTSLDVRPLSSATTTVSVTNATATDPVVLTVPTRLSNGTWATLLEEEYTTRGGHVLTHNTTAVPGEAYDLLQITLERGVTYDLQLSRVAVGMGAQRPAPRYLTDVGGGGSTVQENGTGQVIVQVRDAFDNPVGGVEVVTGSAWANATVTPTNATTDGDGTVTLTYDAPADISGATQRTDRVQVSLNTSLRSAVDGTSFNGSTAVNVSVPVHVTNTDGSGLGGGSASVGVGLGGTSTYTPTSETALLSAENGLWQSINRTDQIVFSDGQPIVDPANSDEYVRTSFTIVNESERYAVEMEAALTTGGSYGGSVSIYRFATDNQVSLPLSAGAAQRVLTADRYNGTDVLNRANFGGSDATFFGYQRDIARMDSTRTRIVVADQDGRVNLSLQGEALFGAIEPDPSTTGDADEFVQVSFENTTNTGGWTISDDDTTVSLPSRRLQGVYYVTADETAFETNHPSVPATRVLQGDLGLDDAGEALELRDSAGDLRDEVAYGGQQTSHGWSLTLGTDEVGNRTAYGDGTRVDTDSDTDWTVESETTFFGSSAAESVAYNGDGTAAGPGGAQSGVSFSVTNTGGSSVTVTDVAISSSGPALRVFESTGSTGQWNREVFVDASTDGYLETGDTNYNQDGYVLGSGATPLDVNPTLASGTTATVSIYEFRDGNGNNAFVDMNGQPVTVTLTFGDGSTKTISFTG